MKSKTSLFDKGLFHYLVKRGAGLWAVLFVLQFLALAMPAYTTVDTDRFMIGGILTRAEIASFIALPAAYLAVRIVFGYMMTSRGTGMIASLPIRREGVFITSFLAGLLPVMAVTALAAVLPIVGLHDMRTEYISVLLIYFSAAMLPYLAFYCSFVLCTQLTGRNGGILLAFVILNFAACLAGLSANSLLTKLIRGVAYRLEAYTDNVPMLGVLTAMRLLYNAPGEYPLTFAYLNGIAERFVAVIGMKELIIQTAIRIPLALIAFLLYRKRHMESASDLVAIKALRPVFRYLMCILCALVTAELIFSLFFSELEGLDAAVSIAILMAVGAFIGYFGAQMLMERSAKVFKGRWLGYVISAAVLCTSCFAAHAWALKYENVVPEIGDVESVRLECNSVHTQTTTLFEPENIEKVLSLHSRALEAEDGFGATLHIEYKLKNGRTMRRTYDLPRSWYYGYTIVNVFNSSESIFDRYIPDALAAGGEITSGEITKKDKTTHLSGAEVTELYYTCILPDMEDGKLGTVKLTYGILMDAAETDTYIYFNVGDETFSIRVKYSAARTIEWLHDHGIYPVKT